VIVLHEFFGLTPFFSRLADRLREERFTVLVPDLYEGALATTVDEASALARGLDADRALAVLGEAVQHMRMNWHPRVGVVGFSLGASLAPSLAERTPVDAVVTYYGWSEVDPARWTTPALVHAAENDEWEPWDDFRSWVSKVPDVELHLYRGTGHWFANEDVPDAFDRDASELAYERTLEFLTHHLS
jgi:carboxymethylenebutenolidase